MNNIQPIHTSQTGSSQVLEAHKELLNTTGKRIEKICNEMQQTQQAEFKVGTEDQQTQEQIAAHNTREICEQTDEFIAQLNTFLQTAREKHRVGVEQDALLFARVDEITTRNEGRVASLNQRIQLVKRMQEETQLIDDQNLKH